MKEAREVYFVRYFIETHIFSGYKKKYFHKLYPSFLFVYASFFMYPEQVLIRDPPPFAPSCPIQLPFSFALPQHRWSRLWSLRSLNPEVNLSQMDLPKAGPGHSVWAHCEIGLDWNHTLPETPSLPSHPRRTATCWAAPFQPHRLKSKTPTSYQVVWLPGGTRRTFLSHHISCKYDHPDASSVWEPHNNNLFLIKIHQIPGHWKE